ncbi:MAG: oxygen-independent coproporphyrinogen III oxidase [Euryarchaeota archaeon]|nr:oxygen-independent coproporphyrinogen III oxidase [Euryarchaeota archaeon]
MQSIIQKYNIPGPRYTSYPTVPYWSEEGITKDQWKASVKRAFDESNDSEGISLYIPLPFCESLCTFCGCHKRITKRHSVESPYIEAVLKEWDLYLKLLGGVPRVKEIHLGGGTPTFFSPENLDRLISGIMEKAERTENYEFSFEAHPNNTTVEHLRKLYELGFRRNSFGVQDYDPKVQKTINRIQSFEQVKEVTNKSREVGYTSISHDLVFGLPHQTIDSIADSIEKTAALMPERIAFYSYAHVPWIKGLGQRGYSEADLPVDEVKRELYEFGKRRFLELGYEEIGMDHFALKSDGLYKAVEEKTLHRNFMGYTSGKTQLMIGLGMSSISDSWYGFAQNAKTVEGYEQIVNGGEIPIFRGHKLSAEDLIIRKHILNIMCHFRTDFSDPSMQFPELGDTLSRLREMEDDGLIEIGADYLKVHEVGRPFIRNVCMAFDLHLIRKAPQTRVFSMTI